MDINCPYCGTHYELDDSLLPEGNVKIKCRVCSNVFILNKTTGVFKELPKESSNLQEEVPAKTQQDSKKLKESSSIQEPAEPEFSGENSQQKAKMVEDESMKSIISEINGMITGETDVFDKDGEKKKNNAVSKQKPSIFQVIMLIIIVILFIIAAASALVHYNILNISSIPFIPSGVSSFLSSF